MKKLGYTFVVLLVIGLCSFLTIDEPSKVAMASNTTVATIGVTTTIKETTKVVTKIETTKTQGKTATKTAARKKVSTTKKSVKSSTKKVEETTKAKKAETKKDYTDDDVYLLAQIVYCEAGGCSKDEMAKVGQVVLNRRDTDYWEFADCKTIYTVLCYKNSYPDTLKKIKNGIVPSKSAIIVAEGLLNGTVDSGLSKDVLWQTGFKPSWNVTVVLRTKWHYYSVLAA